MEQKVEEAETIEAAVYMVMTWSSAVAWLRSRNADFWS